MKNITFLLYLIIPLLFLTACWNKYIDTNMSRNVKDFDFTTQNAENFSLEDLEGGWWLAYFMYTECSRVCPITTPNMLKIEKELSENNIDAHIVSFTVDPDHDTPEVLQKYAEEYQINLDRWTLLTGYEFDTLQDFAVDSFKAYVDHGSPGDVEFAHSTNFFLINPDGEVVKKYDGMGDNDINVIIEDLNKVL